MTHHLECTENDVARYVLAPGAPERARRIAGRLDGARLVSEHRGLLVFTGSHEGTPVTVCATGMGGPSVAIALEELGQLGADTFIRVGSCGVLHEPLTVGDLVVATGAVRRGGAGLGYLPLEHPAVPTFEVTAALRCAAAEAGISVHLGLTSSGDSFYGPRKDRDSLRDGRVSAVEMEADTLFVVGQVRGWRTGALFASDGTPTELKPSWGTDAFARGEEASITVALRAVQLLAAADDGRGPVPGVT